MYEHTQIYKMYITFTDMTDLNLKGS